MSEQTRPPVSGIILAGGQSRRMGRDKALLDFAGAPLLARVIARVQAVCAEVVIVANQADAYARFGVRIIGDVYPGKGSLGGIYSGLLAASNPYALVVACDMPFLNEPLLRYLISLIADVDVVVPRAADPSSNAMRKGARRNDHRLAKGLDLHPLHAVYAKTCLPAMDERLRADDLRLISYFDAVRVRIVESAEVDRFDPQYLSFFNANTPDDYECANQWVG